MWMTGFVCNFEVYMVTEGEMRTDVGRIKRYDKLYMVKDGIKPTMSQRYQRKDVNGTHRDTRRFISWSPAPI
jgi:hypothetical protein